MSIFHVENRFFGLPKVQEVLQHHICLIFDRKQHSKNKLVTWMLKSPLTSVLKEEFWHCLFFIHQICKNICLFSIFFVKSRNGSPDLATKYFTMSMKWVVTQFYECVFWIEFLVLAGAKGGTVKKRYKSLKKFLEQSDKLVCLSFQR